MDKEHPIRWAWDTFADKRERYEVLFADEDLTYLRRHRVRRPREVAGLVARLTGVR